MVLVVIAVLVVLVALAKLTTLAKIIVGPSICGGGGDRLNNKG